MTKDMREVLLEGSKRLDELNAETFDGMLFSQSVLWDSQKVTMLIRVEILYPEKEN